MQIIVKGAYTRKKKILPLWVSQNFRNISKILTQKCKIRSGVTYKFNEWLPHLLTH